MVTQAVLSWLEEKYYQPDELIGDIADDSASLFTQDSEDFDDVVENESDCLILEKAFHCLRAGRYHEAQ